MASSYAKIPNPPRSPRVTKALLKECRWVLNAIDWKLFLHRKLEAPALGIPDEWRWEVHSRMTACRAHLNLWYDNERRRRRRHEVGKRRHADVWA